MIKKGFTILESTFSIMILSIVISFGVYLSSKSFDSFNRFSLMNLAYMQHENRLNLVLNFSTPCGTPPLINSTLWPGSVDFQKTVSPTLTLTTFSE